MNYKILDDMKTTNIKKVNYSITSVLCSLLASPKLLSLGRVKVNFFSALAYSQLSLYSVLCSLFSVLYKKIGPQPHFFVVELLYQSLFAINDVNSRFCNLVELAAGDVVNNIALCVLLNYLLYSGVVRL